MIRTRHIQKMIRTALDVAEAANDTSPTFDDVIADTFPNRAHLEGAVNKLRHAACELEAEILEHYERIPQD